MQPLRNTSAWYVRSAQRAGGGASRVQLVCFPYAGGGSSAYRELVERLPGGVDVLTAVLPGRDRRIAEPLPGDWHAVVDALFSQLVPLLRPPYVLFGHSMGAMLAFEVARRLLPVGLPLPRALLLSGSAPPGRGEPGQLQADLPDAELRARVRRLGGMPTELLDNREMLDLVLPAFRADLRILAQCGPALSAALPVPLVVYGGAEDTDGACLGAWKEHAGAGCRVRVFPGGHFFYRDHLQHFLPVLVGDIADHAREPAALPT